MTTPLKVARDALEKRAKAWEHNGDSARVSVRLGDLRAVLSSLPVAGREGDVVEPEPVAEAGGELSDDALMEILRVLDVAPSTYKALTITRWKDGIDLEFPNHEYQRLAKAIARHAPTGMVEALEQAEATILATIERLHGRGIPHQELDGTQQQRGSRWGCQKSFHRLGRQTKRLQEIYTLRGYLRSTQIVWSPT
jgi:hypothetical protein